MEHLGRGAVLQQAAFVHRGVAAQQQASPGSVVAYTTVDCPAANSWVSSSRSSSRSL